MPSEPKGNEEAHGNASSSTGKPRIRRDSVGPTRDTVASTIASKLPFDILFQIFKEYLAEETPEYPVELLLLICKSWHQAALDHIHLWSTFAIRSESFKFWCSCIPRRLSRCQDDNLFDITIHINGTPNEPETDRNDRYQLYQIVLSLLTGPAGQVARRWRTFTATDNIYSPTGSYDYDNLTQFLVFPTPNLTYLSLVHFVSSIPIFPETPSLKRLHAHGVRLPAFPSLVSAVDVLILNCEGFESSLTEVPQVTTLHVGSAGYITAKRSCLSRAFPKLKSLKLWGELSSNEIRHFSAPALERLSIAIFYNNSSMSSVLACKGLPLEQIWELELHLGDTYGQYTRFRDPLRQLLCAAKKVSVLKIPDTGTLVMVVKILKTECEALYKDHRVILRAREGHSAVLEPGKARGPILDALLEKIPGAKWWLKPLEKI